MKVKITFHDHPCTNHTNGDWGAPDENCDDCGRCLCDSTGTCCQREHRSEYCPDCGCEIERPYCYACNDEHCHSCSSDSGDTFQHGVDVFYSGTVTAEWVNGTLKNYSTTAGHPHLTRSSHCLGQAAPLFHDVHSQEKAIEAVVTHISNVDFYDGVGAPYNGISV